MAEFYLDVSAIGNEYQAYADTPTTWAVPQDGNGLAGPGHTAAVAIATIDCAGATASGTGTVGVLGVTVSATLNATGAALATAIVTAINNSATATGATFSAGLSPLNRLVFARVQPGLTTTVQIMLRVAGVDWNGVSPVRSNITGGGVTAFAGGQNGPFAYLCATTTLFGRALRAYGLLTPTRVSAVVDPGNFDDVIHVRTRRNGVNLEVLMQEPLVTRYDWFWTPAITNRHLLFDDGTLWAGDAGVLTLNMLAPTGITGGAHTMQQGASSPMSMTSRSGQRFRLLIDVRAGSSGYALGAGTNAPREWDGVVFEETPTCVGSGLSFDPGTGNSGIRWSMSNSTWRAKGSRLLARTGSNPNGKTGYFNVAFEYFGLTADVTNIVNVQQSGLGQSIRFVGCSFRDVNGVYGIVSPVLSGQLGPHAIEFEGCTGISNVASGWNGALDDAGRQFAWENFGPLRDWRIESGAWLAEWRTNENFPTLTCQLPGGELWSVKVLLRNVGIWGVTQKVLKLPGYYRDASATRTVTLEFLSQEVFSRSQIGMMLAYIDNTGVVRYQSTLRSRGEHMVAPQPCASSTAPWVLNGQTGFSAHALALTTDFPMKQGSEFIAWVVATGPLVADQTVYLNGEVSIA